MEENIYSYNINQVDLTLQRWLKLQKIIKEEITMNEISNFTYN